MTDDKNKKEQLIVETYKGGVSKNEFNLLEKVEKNNTKDDKFFKMRDLRIEMNQYYQQIINPKKNIEDEDDEEDEEEKLKRKEEEKFDLLKNYSHTIEEFISLFDKKDLENEVILEKIFDYLKKLFESYRMALQLKSQVNNDFQKEIINKVAEYFSKFFESKIFWLLLDIFLEHISKLEGLDDNESYRIIALCYANIVKIEYKLLGNKNKLKIIRDYGVKCKEISERIESIKHKSWFKEFFDIQRELEEEIRFKEEEKDNEKIKIKEKMQEELNKISRIAKEKRKVEFIKYIIDNYPPNGYKKEDDYVKRFNKNPEKTLEDLTTVYHTSNYHGKDIPYERYLIIEQIETELNKMKENND